jgi:hypothetical protein
MKYIIAVVGVILAAFIAILVIVNRNPGDPKSPNLRGAVSLTDYDNLNATISLTTQGKLVGESERQGVRISVTRTERKIEILRGYDEAVERSNTYPNSQSGYESFIRALDNAGFTRNRPSKFDDNRGVCPLGNKYIYDLSYNDEHVSNLWSTSCSKNEGTYAGVPTLTRQLFEQQIPDYGTQVRGVKL